MCLLETKKSLGDIQDKSITYVSPSNQANSFKYSGNMQYFCIAQQQKETFESFSLPNQPRNEFRIIAPVLGSRDVVEGGGLNTNNTVTEGSKRLNFSENLHPACGINTEMPASSALLH
jgi:hypothetical protein